MGNPNAPELRKKLASSAEKEDITLIRAHIFFQNKISVDGSAMPDVLDKSIYARAVKDAKARFKVYPSAVASSWTVKRYKELGGRYRRTARKSKKLSKSIARWKSSSRKRSRGSKRRGSKRRATK